MTQLAHDSMTEAVCGPDGQKALQAYRILHAGYVILPVVAGLDKFFQVLTYWEKYLCGTLAAALPVSPHVFMQGVGGVEIAAGLLVAVAPRIGAYVVAAWLGGIIWNLLLIPGFYDIALRDFGLIAGALALAWLSPPVRPKAYGEGIAEPWDKEGFRETA